jgi:hypothetical protein
LTIAATLADGIGITATGVLAAGSGTATAPESVALEGFGSLHPIAELTATHAIRTVREKIARIM